LPIQYIEGKPTIAYDNTNDKLKVNDVTLEQKIDALNTKIDAIIDGSSPATAQLTGRSVEAVQEGTATTDPGTGVAFDIEYLALLINDSASINLLFSFDGTTYKTLKPSEYVGGISIKSTKLYVKSASSTVNYRAWGWR